MGRNPQSQLKRARELALRERRERKRERKAAREATRRASTGEAPSAEPTEAPETGADRDAATPGTDDDPR
jgi:hypothetical protein